MYDSKSKKSKYLHSTIKIQALLDYYVDCFNCIPKEKITQPYSIPPDIKWPCKQNRIIPVLPTRVFGSGFNTCFHLHLYYYICIIMHIITYLISI